MISPKIMLGIAIQNRIWVIYTRTSPASLSQLHGPRAPYIIPRKFASLVRCGYPREIVYHHAINSTSTTKLRRKYM